MVASWRIGVIAIFAAFNAACAQLPSAPKIKAFADATADAAAIYQKSTDLNAELALKYGEESAARDFITAMKASVPVENENEAEPIENNNLEKLNRELGEKAKAVAPATIKLPPTIPSKLSEKALKPRRQLINAIAKYAKGLAAAADQGAVDQLQAAAINLASTVSSTFTPLLGSAAIPILSPVVNVVGKGIGLAVGNSYALEIRQIMAKTHPFLVEAVAELKYSIAVIQRDNDTQFRSWQRRKRGSLNAIRRGSSRSEAYNDFRTAAAEARELNDKFQSLNNYKKLLDAMVKAHAAIMDSTESSDDDLATFIGLTKNAGEFLTSANAK